MKWDNICDELYSSTMSILLKKNTDIDYKSLIYLTEYEDTILPDAIYMCPTSVFNDLDMMNINTELSVILYQDDPLDTDKIAEFADNVILFTDRADFQKSGSRLMSIFHKTHVMDNHMQELSSLVCQNVDLSIVVNQIAEIYKRPVNIVNNAYSILAHSANYTFDISDYEDENEAGFIPPEVLNAINIKDQRKGKLPSEPILIHHIENKFKHYQTPILYGNVTIGYYSIYLLPDENLSAIEQQYLPQIAKYISLVMQRRDFYTVNKDNYYTNLFASMLSGEIPSNQEAVKRFGVFGYKLRKYKYIFVADLSREIQSGNNIQAICSSLQNIFINSIFTIMDQQAIFLGSYSDTSSIYNIVQRCSTYTKSLKSVSIGISNYFTEIESMISHTEQAQGALVTGPLFDADKSVFMFERYRLPYMVSLLSKQKDSSMFCLPEIERLRLYDIEHETEYLLTLYLYVCYPKNIHLVCEKLHIHKNTLYFRLGKIKEMTELDFDFAPVISMIIISILFMRINGSIDIPLSEVSE